MFHISLIPNQRLSDLSGQTHQIPQLTSTTGQKRKREGHLLSTETHLIKQNTTKPDHSATEQFNQSLQLQILSSNSSVSALIFSFVAQTWVVSSCVRRAGLVKICRSISVTWYWPLPCTEWEWSLWLEANADMTAPAGRGRDEAQLIFNLYQTAFCQARTPPQCCTS